MLCSPPPAYLEHLLCPPAGEGRTVRYQRRAKFALPGPWKNFPFTNFMQNLSLTYFPHLAFKSNIIQHKIKSYQKPGAPRGGGVISLPSPHGTCLPARYRVKRFSVARSISKFAQQVALMAKVL